MLLAVVTVIVILLLLICCLRGLSSSSAIHRVPESGFLNQPPGVGRYLTHDRSHVEFVKGGLFMPHKENQGELLHMDLMCRL